MLSIHLAWQGRLVACSVAVASLLLSTAAFAAPPPSVDLAITGKIVPGACTITTPFGNEIDYGTLSTAQLNWDTDTKLGSKFFPYALHIQCPAKTRISISVSDNRQDSAGGNTDFIEGPKDTGGWSAIPHSGAGLGFDRAGHKIGAYSASVGQWDADSVFVHGGVLQGASGDVVSDWAGLPGSTVAGWYPPEPQGVTYVFTNYDGGGDTSIVAAEDYSVGLSVSAAIAPAKTLTLDSIVKLDGAMLFTLNYL
ncbi:DUF1120 domain-containing protein [Burkholderia sp. Ac-20344]|uniref:DUF1120 domain-containing protein n=1 Tax=Burkholderia sp. Ac-20344 TaxID=2703890 RepID=UPI00197C1792|nr:DUF1120 domain-containing protein [Burkholderia sp. Ac-20344]MBN3836266.1 DUF1120 domain-containing protein [Burkholderia sp. Ac-20344]